MRGAGLLGAQRAFKSEASAAAGVGAQEAKRTAVEAMFEAARATRVAEQASAGARDAESTGKKRHEECTTKQGALEVQLHKTTKSAEALRERVAGAVARVETAEEACLGLAQRAIFNRYGF